MSDNPLTRDRIEAAFDALGTEAAQPGIVAEIAVYGGSRIMLASDIRNATGDVDAVFLTDAGFLIRNATGDVDAVFLTDAGFLYEAGRRVGASLGLPEDWLSQAVKHVAPLLGGAEPNLLPFGEYPRDGGMAVGLRVLLPTPAYVLAMKLLANRGNDDPRKTLSDLADIHGLMRITALVSVEAMVSLLRECYPRLPGMQAATIAPRLMAKIESVIESYVADPSALTRPGTLAEALRRASRDGALASGALGFHLAEFLDTFYLDRLAPSRRGRIEDDPGPSGDAYTDAYLGAVAEHLCRRWQLGDPPAWTDAPTRFLAWPVFLGSER